MKNNPKNTTPPCRTKNYLVYGLRFPLVYISLSSHSYLILRQINDKVKSFFNYFYRFRPIFYLHGRAYRLITSCFTVNRLLIHLILCYIVIVFTASSLYFTEYNSFSYSTRAEWYLWGVFISYSAGAE